MEINIDLSGFNICSYCLGSGKLKAMQRLTTFDGRSIRGKDKTVKCKYCNGSGVYG